MNRADFRIAVVLAALVGFGHAHAQKKEDEPSMFKGFLDSLTRFRLSGCLIAG